MTIAPLPPGITTFYGPNGQLLAGGSVATFIPRTTAAKRTWINPTQATLNTNPLTLSSTGTAVIYGFGAYRVIVKDAQGDTISDSLTFGGAALQTVILLGSASGGNFVIPNGVYSLYIEAVGAGGAGSNCVAGSVLDDVSGGGGGAGGFASGLYTVAPGQVLSYSIGAGGALGSQFDGGDTAVNGLLTTTGGSGSSFKTKGTSVGGVGGLASGGTIRNQRGGAGVDGSHIPQGGGGQPYRGPGNGGASVYGPGGTAANGSSGNSGLSPGSGGGGVMDVNLTNIPFNGGAGADGQIIFSYWS